MAIGVAFTSEPVKPSEIEQIRTKLDVGFTQLARLISDVRKPLPTQTGDGTYLHYQPDPPDLIQKIEAGLKDLSHLGITDIATLIEVQNKEKTGELWDDRQYLMEKLIQVFPWTHVILYRCPLTAQSDCF
jgi:linoleate 8R-lipoxygenase/9,12-octadecadienoate 8-hydroperoxide 8R-isomerase